MDTSVVEESCHHQLLQLTLVTVLFDHTRPQFISMRDLTYISNVQGLKGLTHFKRLAVNYNYDHMHVICGFRHCHELNSGEFHADLLLRICALHYLLML